MATTVKVMMFGQLEQLTKHKVLEISDVQDTDSVRAKVSEQFPQIKGLNYLLALNQEIVAENRLLNDQDELALLPPFAGG